MISFWNNDPILQRIGTSRTLISGCEFIVDVPTTPAFAQGEYQRRIARVRAEMESRGLELLVIHNLSNICYLIGFQTLGSYGYGHYAVVVPRRGDVVLLASDFESHNARLYSWVDRVSTYPVLETHGRPLESLAACLREMGAKRGRVGYESGHYSLTIEEWQRLTQIVPDVEWVDAVDVVDRVKQIKSTAEIAVMRRAAALTSVGLLAAYQTAAEGRSDNQIAAAMYQAVVEQGGEYFSLQPIVTSGRRSGIPNSTFRRELLHPGDPIFIELSGCVDRYSAPALRTLSIGPPVVEVRRAYDACRASVEALLTGLRPGRTAADVGQEAGRALRTVEPNLVWHGYYGYSVGIAFPPMCTDCVSGVVITETAPLVLMPGMTFHCNTSLRKLGEFGATCGETVLITETGCEVLTSVSRDLTEC